MNQKLSTKTPLTKTPLKVITLYHKNLYLVKKMLMNLIATHQITYVVGILQHLFVVLEPIRIALKVVMLVLDQLMLVLNQFNNNQET